MSVEKTFFHCTCPLFWFSCSNMLKLNLLQWRPPPWWRVVHAVGQAVPSYNGDVSICVEQTIKQKPEHQTFLLRTHLLLSSVRGSFNKMNQLGFLGLWGSIYGKLVVSCAKSENPLVVNVQKWNKIWNSG